MVECIECPIGKQATYPGAAACQQCQAGEYGEDCDKCAPGQYREGDDDDASTCDLCLPGKHQNAAGQAACLPCVPGKHNANEGQLYCTDCAINTYSDITELKACKDCPVGKELQWTGGASCQMCAAGRYGGDCSLCAAGMFRAGHDDDASTCDDCPRGFSQQFAGSPVCLQCVPGTYQNETKQLLCKDCKIGKFANVTKLKQCYTCVSGQQATSKGTAVCQNCFAGKYGGVPGMPCKNCKTGRYRSGNQKGTLTSCLLCGKGKYSSAGAPSCIVCSAGQHASQVESNSCTKCEAGRYADQEMSGTCKTCDNGKYSLIGSASCVDCPPGTAGIGCNKCGVDQYRGENDQDLTVCITCPSGYAARTNGSAKCSSCSAGTAGVSCTDCFPGQYRGNEDRNLTVCIACPSGFATDKASQPFCLECDSGMYQDEASAKTCKACRPGQHQDSKKRTECKDCELGTFTSKGQQNLCEKCPPGSDTDSVGATSDRRCMCSVGNFADRNAQQQLSCVSCPPKSTTLGINKTSEEDCVCQNDFWKPNTTIVGGDNVDNVDNVISECVMCPVSASCADGLPPWTQAGHWRVPWREENVRDSEETLPRRVPCLEKSSCLGAGSINTSSLPNEQKEACKEFHAGPLCAACLRGSYKKASTYECLECFEDQGNSVLFLAMVILAILVVVGVMTIATVADGAESNYQVVDVIILKIAFNSGIISAGASNFPLAWPPAVMKMFQAYAIGSATVVGDSLSTDCVLRDSVIRPVQAWAIAAVVIPPTIIIMFLVIFLFCACCTRRKKFLHVHWPVATIVTLLFAHPVVTKAAVKLVACRSVAGRRFMDADFNMSCSSVEYNVWALYVALPLFLGFTIGVPLLYFLILYRYVRKGQLQKQRPVYGFLFSGFHKKAWWFELWNTMRKSLFTVVAILFRPAGPMLQTWAALVLLLLFIVVFSLASPYEHAYLNRLESWALSINVVTLLLGLGLFTNDQGGEMKSDTFAYAVSVAIIVLNSMFLLSVIWTLVRSPHAEYCVYCKKCKEKIKMKKPENLHLVAALKLKHNAKASKEKNEREAHIDKLNKENAALKLNKMKNSLGKALAGPKVMPAASKSSVEENNKLREENAALKLNKMKNSLGKALAGSKVMPAASKNSAEENRVRDAHVYAALKMKNNLNSASLLSKSHVDEEPEQEVERIRKKSELARNQTMDKLQRQEEKADARVQQRLAQRNKAKQNSGMKQPAMDNSQKVGTKEPAKEPAKELAKPSPVEIPPLNKKLEKGIENVRQMIRKKVGKPEKLHKIFKRLDKDQSNTISKSEFHSLLKAVWKTKVAENVFDAIWTAVMSRGGNDQQSELSKEVLELWLFGRDNSKKLLIVPKL